MAVAIMGKYFNNRLAGHSGDTENLTSVTKRIHGVPVLWVWPENPVIPTAITAIRLRLNSLAAPSVGGGSPIPIGIYPNSIAPLWIHALIGMA